MISRFFIDRPIFAAVLSIFIVIAGLASMRVLPIAQYPEIAPPVVRIRPDALQELLARRRIDQPCELDSGDTHERDLSETEHAATALEVTAERSVAIREHEMAVHVIVRDDARHGEDLHASRPRALIELARRERCADGAAHREIGQAAEAGQDDAVADRALPTDLLDRFQQKLSVREPHHDDLARSRAARHHSPSCHCSPPCEPGNPYLAAAPAAVPIIAAFRGARPMNITITAATKHSAPEMMNACV